MNRNYVFYVLVTQCCANSKYDTITPKTATNSSNYVFVGGGAKSCSLTEQGCSKM